MHIKLPTPRHYQERGIHLTKRAFADGFRKILLFMATGGGKSVLFILFVYGFLKKNNKVILVMRRRQLVLQAQRHFSKYGIKSSVVMGNSKGFNPNCNLQICSIDTIARRNIDFMIGFDAVIVDECHDTTSPTYRKFFEKLNAKTYIGLTATPFQVGKKVHDFWDCSVKPIEIHELVEQRYLTDCVIYNPDELDLSSVETDSRTGDYKNRQLGDKMGELEVVGNVVKSYEDYGQNKPAICFVVNKDHGYKVCAEFNEAGIPAIFCDESTKQKDRDEAIYKLQTGKIKVLVNVNIFSTGVDIPEAEVGIMARPTKSEILWIQQVGRLLRPYRKCGKCGQAYDNSESCYHCGYDKPIYIKKNAIIIDNGNNVSRKGLGHPFKVRMAVLNKKDVAKKAEIEKDEFKTKTCAFCFATYLANLNKCPHCDHQNEKIQREIKRRDGKIVPYDEYALMMHRYLELEKLKMERGFRPNFSLYKMYEEFGDSIYQYEFGVVIPRSIKRKIDRERAKTAKKEYK